MKVSLYGQKGQTFRVNREAKWIRVQLDTTSPKVLDLTEIRVWGTNSGGQKVNYALENYRVWCAQDGGGGNGGGGNAVDGSLTTRVQTDSVANAWFHIAIDDGGNPIFVDSVEVFSNTDAVHQVFATNEELPDGPIPTGDRLDDLVGTSTFFKGDDGSAAWSHTLDVSEHALQGITVRYASHAATNGLAPQLVLGDEVLTNVGREFVLPKDAEVLFKVEHLDPGENGTEGEVAIQTNTYTKQAGIPIALGLGAGQLTEARLQRWQGEVNNTATGAAPDAFMYQEDLIGLAAMRYICGRATHWLQGSSQSRVLGECRTRRNQSSRRVLYKDWSYLQHCDKNSRRSTMINAKIVETVEHVLELLVNADYEGLERLSRGRRLNAQEIEAGIHDYPYRPVMPPKEKLHDLIDASEVTAGPAGVFSVWVTLWTAEENRSDLSLRLTLKTTVDPLCEVEVDGILVP